MMDIVVPETCWAYKKHNKVISGIYLVSYSSLITKMHGPANVRTMTCSFYFLQVVHLSYPWALQFYCLYSMCLPEHPVKSVVLGVTIKGTRHVRICDTFFYVLLTVLLSIFILVINQLDAQNLFYSKFISCLYMFRAPCAHRREIKIVLYSLWYRHTYRWPSRAQVERGLFQPMYRTATYSCDDTRGYIIQFWPPVDVHIVLETCRGMK